MVLKSWCAPEPLRNFDASQDFYRLPSGSVVNSPACQCKAARSDHGHHVPTELLCCAPQLLSLVSHGFWSWPPNGQAGCLEPVTATKYGWKPKDITHATTSLQQEKKPVQQRRPSTAINKKIGAYSNYFQIKKMSGSQPQEFLGLGPKSHSDGSQVITNTAVANILWELFIYNPFANN